MKVGTFTNNFIEIKGIIREYYEQLYTNKLDSLDEMDKKFLQILFTKSDFRKSE